MYLLFMVKLNGMKVMCLKPHWKLYIHYRTHTVGPPVFKVCLFVYHYYSKMQIYTQ